MMEQRTLKGLMVYSPKSGVFTWINPPQGHEELLGEQAGSPANGNKTYWLIQIDGKKYKRSHLAHLFMTGKMPSGIIDHINGNSLDDRWMNIRDTTYAINAQNRLVGKPGRELPMGVKKLKSGRYLARIGVGRKSVSLGTFDTVEEAKSAYLIGKEKYHASAFA
ncbi:TPA: hypothetical protein MI728_003732 [Klebsiella aerogenes]|uniref:HNH endonuclease n=1 Tax=Klebsiella TaxID=570 RepID=UPI000E2D6421|nr:MULTISPECIES: AP2 domain-containing protein [Klebsiella]MDG3484748.1 AP2 domain-containing protein [Klebsiella pneumoniae]MDU3877426.1 AP2 domain-containing protein [Klebsiella aerogenes]TXU79238.1 hypothetical protein D4N00_13070 [Klebsiella aerogenes]SWB08800.1 Pathogenesis-related transcriptional factor and ERF protein [Klebsiella pneumoniae]HBY7795738.1 hypothetical protein [Klebsiella aerogenes]